MTFDVRLSSAAFRLSSPRKRRAVRGMIHYVTVHARPNRCNRFLLVVETQKGPSMRYLDSIFGRLLKPIDRRSFQGAVDRHKADAYDKSFNSWDHLVTLVFAQLSGVDSLRGLELAFNANAQAHYHLGVDKIARTTVSDANARRPTEPFAELFEMLARNGDRASRREGVAMVQLIDASPIPLAKFCQCAQ